VSSGPLTFKLSIPAPRSSEIKKRDDFHPGHGLSQQGLFSDPSMAGGGKVCPLGL